jgi:S-adenosylmethionine decarboxylase
MWKNLAPNLIRQRIIIEGTTEKIAEPEQIKDYLLKLAEVTKMEVVSGPFASDAHEAGYSGWINWKTSGCHFYSYHAETWGLKDAFFSVDCYTCKPFSAEEAFEFTKKYFNAIDCVWKEVKV